MNDNNATVKSQLFFINNSNQLYFLVKYPSIKKGYNVLHNPKLNKSIKYRGEKNIAKFKRP